MISRLTFFILLFFSTSVLSHDDTDWIPPKTETSYKWCSANNANADFCASDVQAVCDYHESEMQLDPERYDFELVNQTEIYKICRWHDSINTGNRVNRTAHYILVDFTECDQLDYPNSEDLNDDGKIDHCHASECDVNGEMFENIGLNGAACVANGNGEYCEYIPIQAENTETGQTLDLMKQTGESCSIGDSHNQEDIWEPPPESELPDPNDPNNPPPSNGDTDCTPIGGGFNSCAANRDEVCDEQGVCPQSCGTVNGNFVCIEERDGDVADTDLPDNDNSDNQNPDDPNTPADEGTHSRLDGLLENTDGIESLLRGIKEGISKIPGGGGGDDDDGEEEPNCPDGLYYIGENCVSFPAKDGPEISDINLDEINNKIQEKKSELEQTYANISNSIKSKFNMNLSSSANYESRNINIKGVDVDMGLARIMQHFDIGTIVIFIFSVYALITLLGSRN